MLVPFAGEQQQFLHQRIGHFGRDGGHGLHVAGRQIDFARLVRLDAGDIRWDGRAAGAEETRRFGYMPEARGLYPKMAVGEQVEYFARLHGADPAAARQHAGRWIDRRRHQGRKVHHQMAVVARHRQHARPGMEPDGLGIRAQPIEHQPTGGQCRVTAEIDLDRRREPAQVIIAVPAFHQIGGFRQIILEGNGLHDLIAEPTAQRTDCRWIALEGSGGEGIDLVHGNALAHCFSLSKSCR